MNKLFKSLLTTLMTIALVVTLLPLGERTTKADNLLTVTFAANNVEYEPHLHGEDRYSPYSSYELEVEPGTSISVDINKITIGDTVVYVMPEENYLFVGFN